jgi:hypothetical protein
MKVKHRRDVKILRNFSLLVVLLTCCDLGFFPELSAQTKPTEIKADSKIVAVSLFKNGLAVIEREVALESAGTYVIDEVPVPIHGTMLLGGNISSARVENRTAVTESPTPIGTSLQQELAGLQVTIHRKTSGSAITGTVADGMAATSPAASTAAPNPMASRFLILKTNTGFTYIDPSEIGAIESKGEPRAAKSISSVTNPVLLLDCQAPRGGKATISYLAHGISWAPSYHIDLLDLKRLRMEQHVVIRNELSDLEQARISVISGYPSVQFGHVTSPLAANQSWAAFFQQLTQGGGAVRALGNAIVLQNSAYNMGGFGGGDSSAPMVAPNVGDTLDLNYRSAGKHSLAKGSSLLLKLGSGEVDYERVVEWMITDNRDEWGTPTGNTRSFDPTTGQPLQDDIWDALKFKNQMQFPLTTGPAMVTATGQFKGQSQLNWTNQGEETTLQVNKALSVRARHVEYEKPSEQPNEDDRELVYLAGRRFRKVYVAGELRLCNHRPSEIKLIAKRQFSGDYISGDAEPKVELREEGIWSLNKRNELTWTLMLQPSEEKTIKFEYSVLVPF